MSESRADADPDDLKIIRLNTHRIDEPDATWAATYPYRLTANLRPPEFMQVAFICLHGGCLHGGRPPRRSTASSRKTISGNIHAFAP